MWNRGRVFVDLVSVVTSLDGGLLVRFHWNHAQRHLSSSSRTTVKQQILFEPSLPHVSTPAPHCQNVLSLEQIYSLIDVLKQ